MSTVFSEIYGTYYNVVAKVLTQALDGKLSAAGMQQLVRDGAYGDSMLQLLPGIHQTDGFFVAKLRRVEKKE